MRTLLLALALAAAASAAPFIERIDLYKPGDEGYAFYHIPGLVVTAKGAVLAYAEARRTGRSDWEDMDVVLRRSTDGGQTWERMRVLSGRNGPVRRNPLALAFGPGQGRPGEITYSSPVAIASRDGTVHFLYCREFDHCFYRRSDDDGITFSPPVDITDAFRRFRPEFDWGTISTGPAHGIELGDGRLVVAVWLAKGTADRGFSPSVVATIFSDDHGRTWKRGEIAVPNNPAWPNPTAPSIVELSDGRVMLNVRTQTKEHRRVVTVSPDGAAGWSRPRYDPALLEPMCQAGLARYAPGAAGRVRILFSNPDNLSNAGRPAVPGQPRDRKNLSVKLSADDGRTWPVNRVLDRGPSGYSDLGVLPDGTILCLYDRGASLRHGSEISLCIARFNLEWLTGGEPAP